MPVLIITTNAPIADIDAAGLKRISESLASLLGKPESYIMVMASHQDKMLFAGSSEPTAYLELKSIGLPEDQTASLSAKLCELVEDLLGIARNRIYIEFSNAKRHLFGWNGGTF